LTWRGRMVEGILPLTGGKKKGAEAEEEKPR
jgi:hypothetical protein